MKKDILVRHNINFLEHPLWFQDEKNAEQSLQGISWQDNEGYLFRSGYKIPVKTDVIFLLYLLLKSQETNYAEIITTTQYKILKDCKKGSSKQCYRRLQDSLNRWETVRIKFSGNFYNGVGYKSLSFGVIDSWKIRESDNKLEIRFSPEFLEMMRGKQFFKYVNFTEFKRLDSSLATRLYEILSKSFEGRTTWEINALKLAKKIPLNQIYPSEIIRSVTTAINQINKHTELKIDFSFRQKERGTSILIFKKQQTTAPKKIKVTSQQTTFDTIPTNNEFTQILEVLPKGKQSHKSIIEIITEFYKEHGANYVIRNIRYTNKSSTKNYRSYLLKALQQDWGITIEEDETEKALQSQLFKLKTRKADKQKQLNQEEEREQAELEKKAKEYIDNLSKQELEKLREEALEALEAIDPQIVDLLLSAPKTATGIASRMALKSKMLTIVKERLAFR